MTTTWRVQRYIRGTEEHRTDCADFLDEAEARAEFAVSVEQTSWKVRFELQEVTVRTVADTGYHEEQT